MQKPTGTTTLGREGQQVGFHVSHSSSTVLEAPTRATGKVKGPRILLHVHPTGVANRLGDLCVCFYSSSVHSSHGLETTCVWMTVQPARGAC